MSSSDIISNGKIYYLRFTLCIPSFVLEQKTTCEVFTHTSIYTFVCWISCEVIQVSPHNDTLGYTVSRPHEIPSALPYSEAHGIGLEKAIIHFSNMHTYSTLLCTTKKYVNCGICYKNRFRFVLSTCCDILLLKCFENSDILSHEAKASERFKTCFH